MQESSGHIELELKEAVPEGSDISPPSGGTEILEWRISLSQKLSIAAGSFCLFSVFASYQRGNPVFAFYVFLITLYLFVYAFKKIKIPEGILFSRFSLMVGGNVLMFIFAGLLGREGVVQYWLLANTAMSCVVFSPKERVSHVFTMTSAVGFYVWLELTQYKPFGRNIIPVLDVEYISRYVSFIPFVVLTVALGLLISRFNKREAGFRKSRLHLMKRKEVLRRLQSVGKIGYWGWKKGESDIQWSSFMYELHELPPGTPVKTTTMSQLYPKGVLKALEDMVKEQPSAGKYEMETQVTTAKGNQKWIRIQAVVENNAGDNFEISGTVQDISELKKNEYDLDIQNEQLDGIALNSPGIIFQVKVDHQGVVSIPYISQKANQIFDRPTEQLVQNVSKYPEMVHRDDLNKLKLCLGNAEHSKTEFSWTGRVKGKNGYHWFRVVSECSVLDSGVVWDGFALEITDQKILEEQLESEKLRTLNAAKLASLGQMAGGIAHEINNPLAIIDGYCYQFIRALRDPRVSKEQLTRMVEKIKKTSGRIKSIASGLQQLALDENPAPLESVNVLNIFDLCEDACRQRADKYGVLLSFEDKSDGADIDCRPSEIVQVITNLVHNSIDAIEGRPEKWVKVTGKKIDDRIVFTVTDSGPGIDKNAQEKLFEPFFTTKVVGKGTGLGLSISIGLVESHSGRLFLNTDHTNTQFVIEFPANSENPVSSRGSHATAVH